MRGLSPRCPTQPPPTSHSKDIMEPRVVWGLIALATVGFALPMLLKKTQLVVAPMAR